MTDHDDAPGSARPPEPTAPPRRVWPALLGIAAIVAALAATFGWVAGWWTPGKLTPQRFTDDIQAANGQIYPGFRRAHAKGVCVAGWFEGNADGRALSSAGVFSQLRTPLLGRMSIGGGTPYGLDPKARVRSMALLLRTDDGQEWRMAMNSFPFFGVATVADFDAQTLAGVPDPATGKPDPARMAAFRETHPAAQRFAAWAASAPWPTSFANTTYNGVNTFRFTNAAGQARNVRWSMLPRTPFEAMTPDARESAGVDFLSQDLATRLGRGPLRWDMAVTLAEPGDDINDASQPWPDARRKVTVGTVVIERTEPQSTGACRDVNFDPLILPAGVEGSSDPILAARSAVYAVSFDRRQGEIAHGADAGRTDANITKKTP